MRAVQDAMTPLMEMQAAKVQQAVQDIKMQLASQLLRSLQMNADLEKLFKTCSPLKQNLVLYKNPICNLAIKLMI